MNSWKVPAGNLKWGASYAWRATATGSDGIPVTSAYRVLVTAARQPMVGAQLAAQSESGQEFHALSGNYTTAVADATVATVGPELSAVRSYNSLDARRDGLFGTGWSTRYDMKIVAEPAGSLLVTYPDGRRLRFASKGDGSFQAPAGMYAALSEVSGGGWKLMDKGATIYHFNAQGKLTKIADNRDRAQTLTYGTDGGLAKVTSVGGRSLTFTWTGAHVTSVATDPVDGKALTWTYGYNGDALTSVCHGGAAPNCTTYDYGAGSPYRGLVEDDEPVGYWRLDEPAVQPAPTPTPNPTAQPTPTSCPRGCDPLPTTKAVSRGWGAGEATYQQVTLEQPGALAGTGNTAASFSGTSLVRLPDHALARMSDQLSLELWFKTTTNGMLAFAAPSEPVMSGRVNDGAPLMYVGTDGKLRGQFRVLQSGTPRIAPITSAASVADGQWHHAVLTGSGSTQTLYLDGASVGTLSGAIDHNWLAYATIGHGITATGWPGAKPPSGAGLTAWGFAGQIDEVAVYDRALSAGQSAAHYAARTAGPHALQKITLPSGRVWANNTYDPAHDRLLTHTDQEGGTWKLSPPSPIDPKTGITTVSYKDPLDRTLKKEHDAWRGYRVKSWIDQLDKKTTALYDAAGFVQEVNAPNGVVTNSSYDKRGNLIATASCTPTQAPAPGDDGDGNPFTCFRVGAATPKAGVAWYDYIHNKDDNFDPRNDRLKTFRDGRSSSSTDNTYATVLEYNQYGEQIKQTTPATSDFPSGRSATITYTDGSEPAVGGGSTPAGLVKSKTDYKGKVTTYAYTAAGDEAEAKLPAGLVTKHTYDPLGRVLAKTEVSSDHPNGVTSTFTYDAVSRVVTHKGPGIKNEVTGVTHTSEVKYTYDADGNTLTETASDLTGGDPARTATFTYDAFGRVETVTGPEGGKVSYTYNALGDQTSMVDELGNRLEYAYTRRDELETTTLKNWTGSPVSPQPARDVVLESFAYDPAGRLQSRLDAMGRKLAYTYFPDNRVAEVTAEAVKLNGSTTPQNVVLERNEYDGAGNVVKVVGGGGIERTDYVVDAAGRLTSETFDPVGTTEKPALVRKTAYVYDGNDNLVKATRTAANAGGRVESVEFAYNDDDVPTRRTIENGAEDVTTTVKVDERGLVVEEIDPRGNASGADAAAFTTHYRYDAAGRLVERKEPEVKVEEHGADAKQARPTLRYGYNSAGDLTHEVDEAGAITTSGYDRLGRLRTVKGAAYQQPGGTTITPTETYDYNPAGQVTKYTDPRGSTWTTEYDALGNRVRVTEPAVTGKPAGQWVYEYDVLGELLAATDPTGARVESTYDDLGRAITSTVFERKPIAQTMVSRFEYNTAGAREKEVGPLNRTTTWEVNAAGEVTKETDPAGNSTSFFYDLAGRTSKVTNPLNNSTINEYDLAGRQTAVKETDDGNNVLRSTTFGYDLAGNETSETSAEGYTVRSTYDATDLLTELIEPVSDTKSIRTTYGYDATGALTRATDGRGNSVWTTYNSLGLAEKTIEPATPAHPAEADRTWTYVYDAGGNMLSALQPGGVRIDQEYDQLARLRKQNGSGAEAPTPQWTFDYDSMGRYTALGDYTLDYNDRGLLTRIAKGGTQTAAFTYDEYGNTKQKQDVNGTTAYTWDAADRLKTFDDAVSKRALTYDYDAGDRLKTITSTNPGNKQEFDYDDMDRITSQTLLSASGAQLAKIGYGWDKDDNLTSKVTEGTAGAGANTYTYDRSDRMTSWLAPDGTKTTYEWDDSGNRVKVGNDPYVFDERNRLLSGGGTQYTYTARGTLATETTGGVTKRLVFDAYDQLVSDGDATYTYDNLGRLSSRTQGGAEERFVYSTLENDAAAVTDPADVVKARFGRDPDGRLAGLEENGVRLGIMNDQHDDVVATFSGTGIVDSTAYNPFGEVIASSGTKRRLGFQDEYTDPVTGKVNMASRWYMPGTGGFASRDDWTIDPYPSINLNRYTYAGGNPLGFTDPTGNCPFCLPLLWMAARVVVQVAVKAAVRHFAKQAVKQVGKQVAKQVGKQVAKQTGKQATKQVTKQAAKKTTKQTTRQAAKKTTKKQTTRAKTKSPKVKQPKVKQPKVKQPKVKQPKVKSPKAKKPSTKKSPKQPKKTTKKSSKQPKPPTKKTTSKSGKSKTKDQIKQELHETAIDEMSIAAFGDAGVDVGWGDDFMCYSLKSCAKDVIDELTEKAADEAIEQILDKVVPELPIDSPGSGGTGSCALPSSFVPGTLVLMADGTRKPIEKIRTGDEVLATDPETGQTAPKPVSALITSEGQKNLVDITVTADGKPSKVLTATDAHPFWIPKRQAWVDAGKLQPGMWLQTAAGTYVQASAIQHRTATQRVHNLTVGDFHTYHVAAGSQAVLVHNDGNLSDEECWALADRRRDEVLDRWHRDRSRSKIREYSMIVGAVDCKTGRSAVGTKLTGEGSYCAEDVARDALVQRGSDPADIRFGHPKRPLNRKDKEICVRCQGRNSEDAFPEDVLVEPGGAWGR